MNVVMSRSMYCTFWVKPYVWESSGVFMISVGCGNWGWVVWVYFMICGMWGWPSLLEVVVVE